VLERGGVVSGVLREEKMGGRAYVADYAEADGDFVLGVFGEDGFHYLNCVCFLSVIDAGCSMGGDVLTICPVVII
jgi:hypothetical protein